MTVPQFFAGTSISIVHFTGIEFILAQSPCTMQNCYWNMVHAY